MAQLGVRARRLGRAAPPVDGRPDIQAFDALKAERYAARSSGGAFGENWQPAGSSYRRGVANYPLAARQFRGVPGRGTKGGVLKPLDAPPRRRVDQNDAMVRCVSTDYTLGTPAVPPDRAGLICGASAA